MIERKEAKDFVRQEVRELEPYSADRYCAGGVETYLDFNENAFGSTADFEGTALNRYPLGVVPALKSALARYVGGKIRPENILLGNGSDEVIDVAVRALAGKGDNVVLAEPRYSLFEVCVRGAGANARKVISTEDFQPDVPRILSQVDRRTRLVVVVSPSSGSGAAVETSSIVELAEKCGCPVLVDEAYIEFGGESVSRLALKYQNLIVTRTLSKAWGLAGLRIGYLVANAALVREIGKLLLPENMNSVSTVLAMRALKRVGKMKKMAARMRLERDFLKAGLEALGLKPFDSVANFLVFGLPPDSSAQKIQKKILSLGVLVRDRSSLPMLENCLRVTVGTRAENLRFLSALKEAMQS